MRMSPCLDKELSFPKLTIITASYNGAKSLERSILSVLNQNYPCLEYVIIDGGSTDGSVDIIKKYEKYLSYWVSEPDNGIADAWNKGIKKSTGEIIGMVNSDDWYESRSFKRAATIFQQEPSVEVIHGNVRYWNGDKNLWIRKPHLEQKFFWRFMPYLFPSCFIKRSLYEKYGLFDTSYKMTMDYELMLKFYIKGANFFYVDEIIANFQLGGLSDVKCVAGLIENKNIVIRHGYSKIKAYHNLYWFILRRYLKLFLEKVHFGFIIKMARKLSGQWSYE
jgi:glycosyltransferase involved in cell wall biosynthesis